MRMIRIIGALIVISAVFCGCSSTPVSRIPVKESINLAARQPRPEPVRHEGSLWTEDGPLGDMFVAQKAGRVGDILTVRIVESATASNKADTKTERKSDLTGGIDNLFNMEKWYENQFKTGTGGKNAYYLNPFAALKANLETTFDGNGTTNRSGSLAASISVIIIDVLPNGNLRIAGSREIAVNNETQYLTLTGIVRPRDISSENIVLSTYVADARIEYGGVGVVNDRQKPGWLMRALDTVWPF